MVIRREDVLGALKRILSEHEEVKLAILFGSTARNGFSSHDLDIAVKLAGDAGLLTLGGLTAEIASKLGLREDKVHIVDINQASLPLLWRILREGVVIKGDEREIESLRSMVEEYPDFLITIKEWANLDPEPKVDKAIIMSRVEEVRRNVSFLEERILNRRPEELDYGDTLALERALHRIIEAMLDICRHLVSVYSLGLVESYGDYPKRLASAGKMPKELADELSKLAGLRNILVHRYTELRLDMLYEASRRICEDTARRFIEWVKNIDF